MLSQNASSTNGGAGSLNLHAKAQVAEVLSSRYDSALQSPEEKRVGYRPAAWDERREGLDVVRTTSGEALRLFSNGAQSVPKPGWVIVVTGGSFESGYTWTLYGIPPAH
jgi:hypothetical protein